MNRVNKIKNNIKNMNIKNYLNKENIIKLLILVLAFLGVDAGIDKIVDIQQSFKGSSVSAKLNLIGTEALPSYFAVNATTSKAVEFGDEIEQVDINLQLNASSTTSTLYWFLEFSNDEGCGSATDATIAWFGQDTVDIGTAISSHSNASTTHTWTPGKTGKQGKNIQSIDMASKCVKATFWTNSGGNSSLWAEILGKTN